MSEEKKKVIKVDPTKIIVKGPTFEYKNSFEEKKSPLALKKEREEKDKSKK